MRIKIIPTENLRTEHVPNERASWSKISKFALTFDNTHEESGYGILANDLSNVNEQSSLVELRDHLFNEQRRWHHFGREPDPENIKKIKSILLLIIEKLE